MSPVRKSPSRFVVRPGVVAAVVLTIALGGAAAGPASRVLRCNVPRYATLKREDQWVALYSGPAHRNYLPTVFACHRPTGHVTKIVDPGDINEVAAGHPSTWAVNGSIVAIPSTLFSGPSADDYIDVFDFQRHRGYSISGGGAIVRMVVTRGMDLAWTWCTDTGSGQYGDRVRCARPHGYGWPDFRGLTIHPRGGPTRVLIDESDTLNHPHIDPRSLRAHGTHEITWRTGHVLHSASLWPADHDDRHDH